MLVQTLLDADLAANMLRDPGLADSMTQMERLMVGNCWLDAKLMSHMVARILTVKERPLVEQSYWLELQTCLADVARVQQSTFELKQKMTQLWRPDEPLMARIDADLDARWLRTEPVVALFPQRAHQPLGGYLSVAELQCMLCVAQSTLHDSSELQSLTACISTAARIEYWTRYEAGGCPYPYRTRSDVASREATPPDEGSARGGEDCTDEESNDDSTIEVVL